MSEQNTTTDPESQNATERQQNQLPGAPAPAQNSPEEQFDPNANIPARVLMNDVVEGVDYRPNTYVQFKAKLAAPLEKAGRIDTSDDAIAYCKQEKLEKLVHEDLKKELKAPKKKVRK